MLEVLGVLRVDLCASKALGPGFSVRGAGNPRAGGDGPYGRVSTAGWTHSVGCFGRRVANNHLRNLFGAGMALPRPLLPPPLLPSDSLLFRGQMRGVPFPKETRKGKRKKKKRDSVRIHPGVPLGRGSRVVSLSNDRPFRSVSQ